MNLNIFSEQKNPNLSVWIKELYEKYGLYFDISGFGMIDHVCDIVRIKCNIHNIDLSRHVLFELSTHSLDERVTVTIYINKMDTLDVTIPFPECLLNYNKSIVGDDFLIKIFDEVMFGVFMKLNKTNSAFNDMLCWTADYSSKPTLKKGRR